MLANPTRLSRSGLLGEFIAFCNLLQYWDVGQSRNRVNIHPFADGRATMSVRVFGTYGTGASVLRQTE